MDTCLLLELFSTTLCHLTTSTIIISPVPQLSKRARRLERKSAKHTTVQLRSTHIQATRTQLLIVQLFKYILASKNGVQSEF